MINRWRKVYCKNIRFRLFNYFKKDKESYNALSLGSIAYELLTNCSPFSKNEKDEQCLPKNLKCSIEIISFINGL